MNKSYSDQNEVAHVCGDSGLAAAVPPQANVQLEPKKENWYLKKKYQAAMKRKRAHRRPQFGLESIGAASFCFDTLAAFAGVDLPDTILREVEGALLLFTNLSQQKTTLGVMSTIALYVRSYVSKSLTKTVMSYVEELFKEEQSGDEPMTTASEGDAPAWLKTMQDARTNWALCKNNRAFQQFSKLLGVMVTLGLCKASLLDFQIGGYKLFTGALHQKHLGAFDIVDALFETVTFFTEGMYLCFKTKSITPLLINDHASIELDEEYAKIISWWTLVQCGNLEKFKKVSNHVFDKRLNDLGTRLKALLPSLHGLDRKLVNDKFMKVLEIQNDFVTMKMAGGVRHAPFSVEFFGKSSQGKSTICDQLTTVLLHSQGQDTGNEYRCTYNPSDKYMSGWNSAMTVLKFDDVANEKSQFVEKPPTKAIIEVNNNEMYYANKAELHLKARCFVEPWISTATTNKKDMDAGVYSNCPYSVQRRFIVVTVTAKPQFQRIIDGKPCGIDSKKVREFYTDADGNDIPRPFDDIWFVTVERAVEPEKLSSVAKYSIVKDKNGEPLKNITMPKLCQYMIEEYDEHRENQKAIVARQFNKSQDLESCPHDGCKHLKGMCPYHKDTQLGFESVSVKMAKRVFGSVRKKFYPDVLNFRDTLDSRIADTIYKKGSEWLKMWDWVQLVPAPFLGTKYAEQFATWYYKDKLTRDFRRNTAALWLLVLFASFFLCLIPGFFFLIPLVMWYAIEFQKQIVDQVEAQLLKDLRERNLKVSTIVKNVRDNHAKKICGVVFGLGALYAVARAYKQYYKTTRQGSLEPKTLQDVAERDAEVNVWTSVVQRELPLTKLQRTVSTDQLENIVAKNLVYGTIHQEDGSNGMMNGLFLKSNVILIPLHYFHDFGSNLRCTLRKVNPDSCGGKFVADISISAGRHIPDSDLVVCYCATGGSFKDIVPYLPAESMPATPFRLQWRQKSGEMIRAKGMTKPGVARTYMDFQGGEYDKLTINTFSGLCGAVLVSESVGSVILGIHLGGISGTPSGCYGSFSQDQINSAITELKKVEGVIISGSAGVFNPTQMGVKVLTNQEIHPKSAVNYMPHNSQVEWLGTCIGKTTQKTDVKVTPISEDLMIVCDAPNVYCAPKFNPEWYGYQACLANLAVPAHPYPHELLEVAIKDYKEPIIALFKCELWNDIKPLSDKENVNGIPGLRFVDGIKLSTSAGIPMKGKKRDYIIEVEDETGSTYRKFDETVLAEIDRCEELYRQGERAYCIAKACKKDEILTKDKCRIFYGNSTPLTFLVRKYYLPILRVLQMNPIVSESAVGINAHGPEWEEFHQHATKHGMDRLFGGDYGKYDQKLPSQLLFAALRIFIDCARVCPGYTDEDLSIMEAMTGDLVYAVIAFNGDLIGLIEGTHISGNSLTVFLNGVCGSLNLRCYYYSEHRVTEFENRRKFRDYVAAMTYGDDNIGSVHPDENKFTIKGISEFLAQYGQVYTMPDKESELLDFLPPEEFEFLKRKTVFIPEIGGHVGALVEKSIFKSLHCFMRPKGTVMTEYQAVAQNVDQNLGEWFNHGRDIYEMRREQMKIIANKHGFAHMCQNLDWTFDNRVHDWKEKYGKKHVMFAMPNNEFMEELMP